MILNVKKIVCEVEYFDLELEFFPLRELFFVFDCQLI